MITGDKLRVLYCKKNPKNEVTTKDLLSCGLTFSDINKLIGKRKLSRIKRGYYKLPSFDKIIDIKLLEEISISKDYEANKDKNISPSKEDMKFIAKKYHEMQNGQNLILLEPLEREKRHIIHYIVKAYPDMCAFSLTSINPDKKYIVLKKRIPSVEFDDVYNLIKRGNQAYYNNDLDECITCFTKVMLCGYTKTYVYAKLGLAYLKKNKYNNALKYLTVATLISQEEDRKYDFSNLIYDLKLRTQANYISTIENQCLIQDSHDYGIENLVELTRYISDNDLNVTEAWQKLGLNEEQINIVRLIYARDYYYCGLFEKGDQFFKAYEQSEVKTLYTKLMAKEIQTNKRFYKNRLNEMPLALSLKLKP